MSDISIVFSGGSQNSEAKSSLGGFPSPIIIGDNKNNLFDNVTAKETTQGQTDYRCLYVFNDSLTLNYETNIYIQYLDEIGASIEIGLLLQNEKQSLKFNAIPSDGTGFNIIIQNFTSDLIYFINETNTLANRIQAAIPCEVTIPIPGTHLYYITFKGILGNKSLSTLTVSGISGTEVSRLTFGSPINTIAPDIGNEKTEPNGVPFATVLSPLLVGYLSPAEGFPVWIKRVVTAGGDPVENDGFVLKLLVSGS